MRQSAIKAKLVDLGAYVDDELPDYIMVMVANKKTQTQMSDDLHLFLAANTTKFTTWLHGLLEKLQSITTDSALACAENTTTLPQEQDVKQVAQLSKNTSSLTDKGSSDDAVQHLITASAVAGDAADGLATSKVSQSNAVVIKRESYDAGKLNITAAEEPVIRIRLEHDEFEDESGGGDIVPVPRGVGRSSRVAHVSQTTSDVGHKRVHEDESIEEYVPQKYRPFTSSESKHSSSRDETRTASALVVPRRHVTGLNSLIGAVLVHDNEDHDEYDPCRPAIGNVASIVKVTERKSSVPMSMQANRSLLLRAMQQAEQSVATIKKRAAKEALRQSRNRPHASVHRRLHGNVTRTVSDPDKREESLEVRRIRASPIVKETVSDALPFQPLAEARTIVQRKLLTDHDERECSEARSEYVNDKETRDSRKVHCSAPEVIDTRKSKRISAIQRARQEQELEEHEDNIPHGEIEVQQEVEEDDNEEDDEEVLRMLLIQQKKQKMKLAVKNPKFVVTLNHVYPHIKKASSSRLVDDDDDIVLSSSPPSSPPTVDGPRNVVRVKPQCAPVFSQPDTAAVVQGPQSSDTMPTVPAGNENKKSTERCKFWPVCKNGDTCPFHHPTSLCKTFPACRFGDKCLYIHPTCKYDGKCKNPSCAYTHVMPRPAFAGAVSNPVYKPHVAAFQEPQHIAKYSSAVNPIKCKFFPNCTDVNCAFTHPKMCRYGLSCTSKSVCQYDHPQLPSKNQMKWTPGFISTAEMNLVSRYRGKFSRW